MPKFFILLLSLLILPSCATDIGKQNAGHFADATTCFQTTARNEKVKVPTAPTITVVDVPLGNDAGAFGLCMGKKGHPVPQANVEVYLNLSRACLSEARHAANANEAYANCIDRNNISGNSGAAQ